MAATQRAERHGSREARWWRNGRDLIVDALGAAVISGFGWWHMKRNRPSFIEVWIDRFVERNPRLFKD